MGPLGRDYYLTYSFVFRVSEIVDKRNCKATPPILGRAATKALYNETRDGMSACMGGRKAERWEKDPPLMGFFFYIFRKAHTKSANSDLDHAESRILWLAIGHADVSRKSSHSGGVTASTAVTNLKKSWAS